METYHAEHNQPKDIARNFRIKRPDKPSEACLLVRLERIAWCPLQHGPCPLAGSKVTIQSEGSKAHLGSVRMLDHLTRLRGCGCHLKLRSGIDVMRTPAAGREGASLPGQPDPSQAG